MTRAAHRLVAAIVAFLIAWGIGAFVSLEPNFLEWESGSRVAVIIVIAITSLLSFLWEDL